MIAFSRLIGLGIAELHAIEIGGNWLLVLNK